MIAVETPVTGSTVKMSPDVAYATCPLAAGPNGAGTWLREPMSSAVAHREGEEEQGQDRRCTQGRARHRGHP